MLRQRIIFTLIYNNGFFTQSRNFRLQRVGDATWLEKHYQFQKISFSIDELIILDASRNNKSIDHFAMMVSRVAHNVFIPVSAGGGVRKIEDAETLFNHGADKIVVNSILVTQPELVKALVNKYGSQSIVASIDYKKIDNEHVVFIADGSLAITPSLIDYIGYVESLNVGEIMLNSIDQDGTGFGYDVETYRAVSNRINVPLIILGGAGNERHFLEGLQLNHVSAVATANLFNFLGDSLPNARRKMIDAGMNIASWELN